MNSKVFLLLFVMHQKGQVNKTFFFEEYLQKSHESIIQTFNSPQINENLL